MIVFSKKIPLAHVFKGFQHFQEERKTKEHLVLRYVWNHKFNTRNGMRMCLHYIKNKDIKTLYTSVQMSDFVMGKKMKPEYIK